jgi:hypothetical protein
MNHDVLAFEQRNIRGADGNSLLRMSDLAHELLSQSTLMQDRTRADKAIQRIAKELRKRQIRLYTP